MKSFAALFVLLSSLAISGSAQLDTIRIPLPGSRGMVSNADPTDIDLSASYYMKNTDIVTTAGVVQKRLPLQALQQTTPVLWGAFGYFERRGQKLAIGVTSHGDYSGKIGQFVVSDSFSYDLNDSLDAQIFPYTDAYHDWTPWENILIHCDGQSTPTAFTTEQGYQMADSLPDTVTFEPRLISLGLEAPGQLRVGLVNQSGGELTATEGYVYNSAFLIDTTGVQKSSDMGVPSVPVFPKDQRVILSMFEGFEPGDTTAEILVLRKKLDGQQKWYVTDTLGYKPAAFTVGLVGSNWRWPPAPVPYEAWTHVCTVDVDASQWIFSTDRQSYTYLGVQYNDYNATAQTIVDSINTISGLKDSARAYIPRGGHPVTYGSTYFIVQNKSPLDTLGVRVDDSLTAARQSYGRGQQGSFVYIDSIADTTTVDEFDRTKIDTTYRRPGELLFLADSSALPDDTFFTVYDDSLYALAIAYYDPPTGIESPVGPILWTKMANFTDGVSGNGDTAWFYHFGLPQVSPDHPSWIRIYQSVRQSTRAGAGTGGDTVVLYGIYETRLPPFGADSLVLVLGNWSDSAVVFGMDTASILIDTVYEYQQFFSITGDPVLKIPFEFNMQIPATDIARVSYRLYAIGDPEFPNRIYYSQPDSAHNWPLTNFIKLDEAVNDELVAIEQDQTKKGMYALKHNSCYHLRGAYALDPDYDFTFRMLSETIGAVSRHAVVRYGGDTYFLSPDLKAYVLDGGVEPREISQPIENWFDTMYSTYELAAEHARVYVLGDHVLFGSDSSLEDNVNTALPMAYHPKTQTWTLRDYDTDQQYKPVGSFQYNASTTKGFGYYDWLMFRPSLNGHLRGENRRSFLGDLDTSYFPFEFETKAVGSGVNQHRIEEILLTVKTASRLWLRYTIYNAEHDSLVSDSIYLSSGAKANQRIVVDQHNDTRLIVRFWTKKGEQTPGDPTPIDITNWPEIKEIRLVMRDLGSDYDTRSGP